MLCVSIKGFMKTILPLFKKSPPQKILLITLRYLGDTLLTTPLLNALRAAYPEAQIDVLLYDNTKAMLAGNPAVTNIISTTAKPRRQEYLQLLKRIFRQYDLAITTQTSDKVAAYAMLAAPVRIGFVPPKPQTGWFKRYIFSRFLEAETEKTHTVLELLKLCQLLPIPPAYDLTPPRVTDDSFSVSDVVGSARYAVLHVMPQWRYKQWTREGWIAVAEYLYAQGVQVILSGGPVATEVDYLNALLADMPAGTVNLAGRVSLAQLAQVISGAQVFVGVDTGTTHLAAATQVPTVALFGPTDPVKWTPWPAQYQQSQSPFVTHGSQQVNNVYLIQGQKECVPCYLEGCLRNRQSHSECLDTMSPQQVIDVISSILKKNAECG